MRVLQVIKARVALESTKFVVTIKYWYPSGKTLDVEIPKDLHDVKKNLGAAVLVALKNKEDLQYAKLRGAILRGAILRGANLRGANLEDADLQDADLQGANLQNAFLRGANLQNAFLQNAILQGANLQNADLLGAFLQGAFLQGADLQGADLQGAILFKTDLRSASRKLTRHMLKIVGLLYESFASRQSSHGP